MSYHFMFKFIIVGDSSVGKSCILKRFETNEFTEATPATVGVEYVSKRINIEDHQISLQIWDTAGQENLFSLVSSYFRNSCGILLVFDISRRSTFEHLTKWFTYVDDLANPNAKVIIIGNKSDLESKREVKSLEAEIFATQRKCAYIETSARNGKNVNELFFKMCQDVYADLKAGRCEATQDGAMGIKQGELPSSWAKPKPQVATSIPMMQAVSQPENREQSCCSK